MSLIHSKLPAKPCLFFLAPLTFHEGYSSDFCEAQVAVVLTTQPLRFGEVGGWHETQELVRMNTRAHSASFGNVLRVLILFEHRYHVYSLFNAIRTSSTSSGVR